jgi:phosphatidylethanolamine/phosphatidyl-N-methylethanolamine N-methyltransferase
MTKKNLKLTTLIEDEFRFLRTWVKNPSKVGAVSPSSRALARLMVQHARPDPSGYTLELGPGTGVATQALIDAGIPPERIVAVEHNPKFCRLLRKRFPKVNFVEGDAFDLEKSLADFAGIRFSTALSGLPLLSFPKARRIACIEGALDRLRPGASFIQFSYGLYGPLEPIPGRLAVTRSKWVVMNLPPARVWTYSRP